MVLREENEMLSLKERDAYEVWFVGTHQINSNSFWLISLYEQQQNDPERQPL